MPAGHEIEYELTYLIRDFPPEIRGLNPKHLIDIYVPEDLAVHPHLRLRQKGKDYEITKKQPIDDADVSKQTEITIPLDEEEFRTLALSSKRTVSKDRYKIVIDGYPAEVDVFSGPLKGLVLIDFEFVDDATKAAFKMPDVCLADVTQEEFIAGGFLAGRSYADIASQLDKYGYNPLFI